MSMYVTLKSKKDKQNKNSFDLCVLSEMFDEPLSDYNNKYQLDDYIDDLDKRIDKSKTTIIALSNYKPKDLEDFNETQRQIEEEFDYIIELSRMLGKVQILYWSLDEHEVIVE